MGSQQHFDWADSAEPTDKEISEAIQWLVLFEAGLHSADDFQAFNHWKQQPKHQLAWQRLGRASQYFEQIALNGQQVADSVRKAECTLQQKRKTLKKMLSLGGMGLILTGGFVGARARSTPIFDQLIADLSTSTGEQIQQRLQDGSSLTLNTQSAMDIDFSASPEFTLRYGEAFIEHSGATRLRVDRHLVSASSQAAYVVSYRDGICQLHVLEGAVRCWMNGTVFELHPEESLEHRNNITTRFITDLNALSWRYGMLTVERMTLGNFIQELNRYRAGYLACEDSVASLRLTGSFPINSTDAILDNLCQILPVRQQRISPYWVRLMSV